jgi:hypothetical protein
MGTRCLPVKLSVMGIKKRTYRASRANRESENVIRSLAGHPPHMPESWRRTLPPSPSREHALIYRSARS